MPRRSIVIAIMIGDFLIAALTVSDINEVQTVLNWKCLVKYFRRTKKFLGWTISHLVQGKHTHPSPLSSKSALKNFYYMKQPNNTSRYLKAGFRQASRIPTHTANIKQARCFRDRWFLISRGQQSVEKRLCYLPTPILHKKAELTNNTGTLYDVVHII